MADENLKTYEIDVGGGRIITLEGPSDVDPDELRLTALTYARENPLPEPKGFWGSLATGAKENVTGPLNLATVMANPEDVAAQQKMLEDYQKEHAGTTSFSNVQEAYKKGLGPGIGETWLYGKQLFGGSIGAGVGGIAGGLGGAATPVPGGALAGSTAGLTLSHVQEALMAQIEERERARAAGEPVPPFDFAALGGATAVMGALDRFGFGVAGLGKLFGAKGSEVGSSVVREAKREKAAKLAGEGIVRSGLVGTAKTAAVESPIEVGQDVLTRAQAGQDLTSPEAIEGYKESAIGGLFLSPMGGLGRRMEVGGARKTVQNIDAQNIQDAANLADLQERAQAGQDAFEVEDQAPAIQAQQLAQQQEAEAVAAKKAQFGLENLSDEKSRLVISAYERLKNDVPSITPSQVVNQAIGDVRASIEILENQYDSLVQNNDLDAAAEVKNQIIAETAQLQEWGGVTEAEKSAVEKELSKTQTALQKAMDEMKAATTPEAFEKARAPIPELQNTIKSLESKLQSFTPIKTEQTLAPNPFEQPLDETKAEIKDPTQPMDELRLNEQHLQELGIRNAKDRGMLEGHNVYDPVQRNEVAGVLEEYIAKQKNGPTEQQQAALDFLKSLDTLAEGENYADKFAAQQQEQAQVQEKIKQALAAQPAETVQPQAEQAQSAPEQQAPNPVTPEMLAEWGVPTPAIQNPDVGGTMLGLDLNSPAEAASVRERLNAFYSRFKNPKIKAAIASLQPKPTIKPTAQVQTAQSKLEQPTTQPKETANAVQEQGAAEVPMGERPQTGKGVREQNKQGAESQAAQEGKAEEVADEGATDQKKKPTAATFEQHVENRVREKEEKDKKTPVGERLQTIATEAKKPSGWVKKTLDSIMRAIDATWDYKEMRKGRDSVEELVNLGLLAQIGHFGGLSRLIVETGGMKYDAKDGMVKAVNSKFNGKALNDKIIELAKNHGLDYDRARIIVGDGLEGARVLDMMAQQEKAEARIAELEAKSRNKGEEKELNDLKEKWDDVVFHITREEAEMRAQAFKKYPKEMKELKDIKNGMREWLVKALVDSGEWTEKKAERMLDNADWIPFQREFSEDERASMEDYQSYASKLQHTMKQHKFKGSERQVTDVIDNFESWALYAARSAAQNMATRTLLKDAVKRFGDQVQKTNPPTPANKNRVAYYWEDGEKQYVEFQSPSMAALFNSGFISPQLDKVTQFFNTLFRMTIIALPTFSAVNLVRDSHQAMTKAGLPAHKAAKIMPLAIKEMVRLMRQGTTEAHEQLKPFGLVGAAADISTVSSKELSELTGYKALSSKEKGVIAKMQDYGLKMAMWSDNAVRQAVYTVAKDSGESDASARQIAANIINFRTPLGSRMLHTMAAWTPFMRAIISDQRASLNILSGRGQSNQSKKQVWKNYAMTTATLVAMKMILAAAMEDDEDYKKMSPEQRARQITIPFSGGWGIPTRVTLDTVPQALAEMMANQFTDNYVDATRNRGALTAVAVEALLPYSEPLPAWPKVALEQMTNKNFFTGQPIVGHEMSKKSGFLQYSPDTSELGRLLGGTVKEVGDAFGFDALGKSGFASPKRIDHALRGLLGSVGAGALLGSNLVGAAVGVRPSMSTKDLLASIPGATQPGAKEFNSAARQDFYDLADRVTRAAEDLDAYVERGETDKIPEFVEKNKGLLALDKPTQAIRDQLNRVRKTIEFISNDKNRTQEKRTAEVRRLKETEARMIKQIDVRGMREQAGL